jgi:hypothetical protein
MGTSRLPRLPPLIGGLAVGEARFRLIGTTGENLAMTRILEQIDAQVSTTRDLGRAALPPPLAAVVDALKVGSSLLQTWA